MNKGGYQSWDGKTKNAVVQLTTFDSEYKAKVHSFKSTENEEHVIFPDRTKMIGSDKILLFGFNDRKFKFGMITISDK